MPLPSSSLLNQIPPVSHVVTRVENRLAIPSVDAANRGTGSSLLLPLPIFIGDGPSARFLRAIRCKFNHCLKKLRV